MLKNCIIDLPIAQEVEAEIIEFFCEKDDLIVFAKTTLTKLRDPIFLTEQEYEGDLGKSVDTVKWYSVNSKEELIIIIKEMGMTYEFYIVSKNSTSINNYKFRLYAYEHHIIYEKEDTEHRSLFIDGVDLDLAKITLFPKLEKVLDKYNHIN